MLIGREEYSKGCVYLYRCLGASHSVCVGVWCFYVLRTAMCSERLQYWPLDKQLFFLEDAQTLVPCGEKIIWKL